MQQAIGVNYPVAAWRGIAGPKGMPKDVDAKLIATIKKIAESKEWKEFAASKGYGTAWAPGADFAAFMAKGDAAMGVDDEGGGPRQVGRTLRGGDRAFPLAVASASCIRMRRTDPA